MMADAADNTVIVPAAPAAEEDSSYLAAVEAMRQLPKINPPTPIVMPTLRPTPPVVRVDKKRPLPFDVQLSMIDFEESSTRQAVLIAEQKGFTAITVSTLQHFVTISDGDVAVNEAAGREIVHRAEARALMCLREDAHAARTIVLAKALERIQRDGEALYALGVEMMGDVERAERDAMTHSLHWERTHRPPGVWSPESMRLYVTSCPRIVRANSPPRGSSPNTTATLLNGVLVPSPPAASANPYRTTGQIRHMEEQQRRYDDKRRQQDRNDCVHDETIERMDLCEEESRAFMAIESLHVEESFLITHPSPRRPAREALPTVEFTPIYDTEQRYNAARTIQCMGRQRAARKALRERMVARDAAVDLLVKQDAARQSLLSDPLPHIAAKEREAMGEEATHPAGKKSEASSRNNSVPSGGGGYTAFGDAEAEANEDVAAASPSAAAAEEANEEAPIAPAEETTPNPPQAEEKATTEAEAAPSGTAPEEIVGAPKTEKEVKPTAAADASEAPEKKEEEAPKGPIAADDAEAIDKAISDFLNRGNNHCHKAEADNDEAGEKGTLAALVSQPKPAERVSLKYLDMLVGSAATPEGTLALRSGSAANANSSSADTDAADGASDAPTASTSASNSVEPLTATWKALLQLAVTSGTDVRHITSVLTAYGAMPPAEEMLEAVLARQEAAARGELIDRLPFCEQLLQAVIFGTTQHKYRTSQYQAPTRWVGYGEGSTAHQAEEETDVISREEEDREGIIQAQIGEVLVMRKKCEAVLVMAAEHSPSPYAYAPPQDTQLVATTEDEEEL